jgi:hypothetical protein
MERRHFLRLAFGIAAGSAVFAATTNAAPLAPQPRARLPAANDDAHPAVTTGDEVEHLKPEQVRWGHHWHRHWHRRHWGWHRRHWSWHRHRWHRHHWRRRWW